MRPARLDDSFILLHQTLEGRGELVDRRQELVLDGDDGGDVHCRRERVVRALRHIAMVVRMQKLLARNLIAAIRQHLVDVHVRLRAAARLPHGEREVPVQITREDFVRRLRDGVTALLVEPPERRVGKRRRLLQDGKGADDLLRHLFRADGEILEAPLRLCPPIAILRYANLSERIMLDLVLHKRLLLHLQKIPSASGKKSAGIFPTLLV